MHKLLVGSVISIAFLGCAGGIGDGSGDDALGQAVARITSVPQGVGCVSITVAGPSRSVVDNFDVTPGQTALLRLGNLPVGNDLFSASAYPVACSALAGAQASWVSTSVVGANISAGTVANLELNLEPAGGANVGINFGCGDGGVCPDGGPINYDGGTGDGGPINYDGGVNDLSPNPYDGGGADLARPADLAHFGD